MRAQLKFWERKADGTRWLRMTLHGADWPDDWAVEYQYLESWGMLTWFESPPAEGEGLQADRDYQMSGAPQPYEFAQFLDNLHQLISEIKPRPQPESGGIVIEDEREYK